MQPPSAPDDDTLQFIDEVPRAEAAPRPPWHVLVVDDEPDVHDATELALRGLLIEGRPLKFVHAYSAAEALEKVAGDPDIAVVLLDVVMETRDAGLVIVREIRETLARRAVRIILRTGQPGYAPELDTVATYDINDYKTKSDLTRVRLYTSLTVAIRSYWQLHQLEQHRRGLELIVAASADLSRLSGLQRFAEGVVTQLCALLGTPPEGLVCAHSPLNPDDPPQVIAAAGAFSELIHRPLHELPSLPIRAALQHCLSQRQHVFDGGTCLYFQVRASAGIAAYVHLGHTPDEVDRGLLQAFCASMAAGFDNVMLHQQLADLAYHDPLLHLPNRHRFIQLIDAKRGDADATLALVDIDDFAEINAVLGHHYADLVLKAVATRLQHAFGHLAVQARVSADVFGLLGPHGIVNPDNVLRVFAQPFMIEGEAVRLSATSGLVRLGANVDKGADLLKDASIALKQAKHYSRSKAEYFSAGLGAAAHDRMRMLSNLRAAFSAERLFVVYQPQIELASGRVIGAEALLRWRTDTGDFVPPDQFIPLAERSGLILHIGEWVLRCVCRQLKRLHSLGQGPLRMAINVSHIQFREPDFVSLLQRVLADCEVDPRQIELELTESVAMDNIDLIAQKLSEIRHSGISVAIDDFGTGFSSLAVLRRLPVDRVKIDRAFINELDAAPAAHAGVGSIASLIIELGKELNLVTIAEGIETDAQLQALQRLGCHEGQGYLIARPMPADQFEAWLASRQAPTP